jgi:NAD-dependent deacetylase
VPTFRGAGGLWRNFRPEELATPEAFLRDPGLVWEWYRGRRRLVADCTPNPAHHALARHALTRDGVRIVTQNVDGLHARAALIESQASGALLDRALPLELHGSILRSRCTACGARTEDEPSVEQTELPVCQACGGVLRPDVVWFGEMLDAAIIGEAQQLATDAELCLVVGTSSVVYPAAGLASLTRANGGAIIEINPEETPLTSSSDVSLRGLAGDVLPRLLDLD